MSRRPTEIDSEQRRIADLLSSFDAPAPESLHRRVEEMVTAHESQGRRGRTAGGDRDSPARVAHRRPFSPGLRRRGCRDRSCGGRARRRLQRWLPHAEPAPGRGADAARCHDARAGGEPGGSRPADRRGRRREVPRPGRAFRLAQHRDAQRSGRWRAGHDGLLCQRRRRADWLRDPRRAPYGESAAAGSSGMATFADRVFNENGTAVVTWQRDGHLCVMSGHGVSSATLLKLAGSAIARRVPREQARRRHAPKAAPERPRGEVPPPSGVYRAMEICRPAGKGLDRQARR